MKSSIRWSETKLVVRSEEEIEGYPVLIGLLLEIHHSLDSSATLLILFWASLQRDAVHTAVVNLCQVRLYILSLSDWLHIVLQYLLQKLITAIHFMQI